MRASREVSQVQEPLPGCPQLRASARLKRANYIKQLRTEVSDIKWADFDLSRYALVRRPSRSRIKPAIISRVSFSAARFLAPARSIRGPRRFSSRSIRFDKLASSITRWPRQSASITTRRAVLLAAWPAVNAASDIMRCAASNS
jgi:hypothetical protein